MKKIRIRCITGALLAAALVSGGLWIRAQGMGTTGTEVLSESALPDTQDSTAEDVVTEEPQETTLYEKEQQIPAHADMQEQIEAILAAGTQNFFAGYAVDESFLLWVQNTYGDEALQSLADGVEQATAELWYMVTEHSIHALWMEYCGDTGYASYLLSNVRWIDCADEDTITMDFIGDINFDENWDTMRVLDERGGMLENCISGEILEELSSADIAMANNEFTLSLRGTALEGKSYVFRADPLRVRYYKKMGIDIVSLANNHTWDYGEDALLDTLAVLKDENISYVGAGKNLAEASKIPYFVANGRKIAIVSATQIERYHRYTKEATEDSAGVLKTLDPELFVSRIREAKANSDYVIAYVHWGTEGNLYPDADERALAELYTDAGADVVIGGHAHRLQGGTFIDGKPVLYSLGNFWFSDGALYTSIAHLTIQKNGALNVSLLPCEQKDFTVSLLAGQKQQEEFYKYIADLSSGVGISEDGTLYDIGEGQETEGLPALLYQSGQKYRRRHGDVDLEGNSIDIVGNVK